jgi:hypothetical protein
MHQFSNDLDVFDQSIPWQARALRASVPHPVCGIIMAMTARQPRKADTYGATADILESGQVVTKVRHRGVWSQEKIPIGSITAVRDNVRRLADHCKFSDAEREALFVEFRRWIRTDYRVKSEVKAGM